MLVSHRLILCGSRLSGQTLLIAELASTAEVAAACNSTLRNDASHFEGLDWTQIIADDWAEYGDAFFWFSPEAFLYSLPSLLVLSLEEGNLPLVPADALVLSLDTSADPDRWDDWFREKFCQLTSHEIQALQNWAIAYLASGEKGEGSEFARVRDTLVTLELALQS